MPETLHVAQTVEEALSLLGSAGTAPLAGGTWAMRAPLREEPRPRTSIAIGRIAELRTVAVADREVVVGACATHAEIAGALAGVPECRGLVQAALGAANPAVRQVATIGGNLCTVDFAAQDLIPALLALAAEVEIRTAAGAARLPLDVFLSRRVETAPGWLLTRVFISRGPLRSAHARLPLRKAGDYPVAIVSLAASVDEAGHARDWRIAVGSVEPVARRWSALEAALSGRLLDPGEAAGIAADHTGSFTGRDGVEAPGWYRVQVLPALVRRAVAGLVEGGR